MDSSDPVVIRICPATIRIIAVYGAVTVAILWASMAVSMIGGVHGRPPLARRILVGVGFTASYGVYLALLRRRRVILRQDRIEIRGSVFPTRSIKFVDIKARRTNVGPGVPHQPILILTNGREVMLPAFLERNETLSVWLRTLPYRQRRKW